MRTFSSLSPRLRFVLVVFCLHLSWLLLWRLAFAWNFVGTSTQTPIANMDWWKSFYLGVKFDIRLSIALLLPLLFLGWLPAWLGLRMGKANIWRWYLVITWAVVQFLYLTDWGHYAYQTRRVNLWVLEFLQAPSISAQMVWESYPVIWGVLGYLIVMIGYYKLISWLADSLLNNGPTYWAWQKWVTHTLVYALAIGGLYGRTDSFPLRWGEAFYTNNPYLVSLGLNPVLLIVDTSLQSERPYNEEDTRRYYPVVADYLGIPAQDRVSLNYLREIKNANQKKQPYNIVVIFLESLGSFVTGRSGNPLDPTPNIDALSNQSLLFTHFLTPTPGTARSIFTLLTGLPDVDFSSSSTRNPLVVNQHMPFNELKGYDRIYMLGGNSNWGNLRGVLTHNLRNLELIEEGQYEAAAVDTWGISDYDLLEAAHQRFKKNTPEEPFVALIQTAGSHRPYTIPDHVAGFQPKSADPELLKSSGFGSLEEYNAFRFLDFSVENFFKQAKQADYYKNTVFVLLGDHGLPYGGKHTPSLFLNTGLQVHHVPLIIHAPGITKRGKVLNNITSEMDVIPILSGMLGFNYQYRGFGKDVLNLKKGERHYAFTFHPSTTSPELRLLDEKFLLTLSPSGEGHLYQHDGRNIGENVARQYPKVYERMAQMAKAFLETNKYLLYHNPSIK